ncbi:MAG: MFS transporter [Candidatus Bathyarchaeota archaeon]|nr:MAG: MFS transporter [Candidatus Bathyarchaeota archaeon]
MKMKIYSGTVLILGVVQLIESLAFAIPLSFFPNYAIGLGASVASIGLFTSSFMLAAAIMAPRMGTLSDRYGRKRILLVGLLGDVLIGVLTGLAPSWQWLLVIRVINGVVSSAAMLSGEALLMDTVSSSHRGEASGFVTSMSMIGRNLGPVFGGTVQLASYTYGLSLLDSYRIPYFVDSILALFAFLLVALKIKEHHSEERGNTWVRVVSSKKEGEVLISTSFKVLLVCVFVNGMGVGFIIPISVLFYNDKFGITPFEIGFIISVSGFVGLLTSWAAGRLSDKIGRKPLIVAGNFVSRLSGLILPLTNTVNQAAWVVSIRSLGFNISMPALRAFRADLTPSEARGRFFGMFMTAFTTGGIIGPIVSTYLYDIYRFESFQIAGISLPGYGIPFFVNAILGIVSTIILLVWVKDPSPLERNI